MLSPAGKPAAVTPVTGPPAVYCMFAIGVLMHNVWASVPVAEDNVRISVCTVMVPEVVTCVQVPPVVVMVNG